MSDRTYTTPNPAHNQPRRVAPAPAAESRQWDERLRRARLMKADADVAATAALLADDQPFDTRLRLAAEHEQNLLRRAQVRTRYGIPTTTDTRVLTYAATRNTVTAAAVTR